jgi:hypothetical protein
MYYLSLFFCLDAKEAKNQGKMKASSRSARLYENKKK